MAKSTKNQSNVTIIQAFYKALENGDAENVAKHLASDLEWWFHGPPQCQHMRRVLTGETAKLEFRFEPQSVTVVDEDMIIAEGWEGAQAYWVHVWSLKDGLMTQLREYFNTWLTVRDLRPNHNAHNNWEKGTLWQSQQPGHTVGDTMPGLVLAI